MSEPDDLEFHFAGPVIEWRGPAPFYFVRIAGDDSEDIKFAAQGIEYWGQVPVIVRIEGVDFTTALFPKDGEYLLPLKVTVQKDLGGITVGEVLEVGMSLRRERA